MSIGQRSRRLRGVILKLVYENQEEQRPRMDDLMLNSVLDRLGFDVSRNEMRTLLDDLGERGLLKFQREKDVNTGRLSFRLIQVTPSGRDLVEKTETDTAVDVE